MLPRAAHDTLERMATGFRVLTITGPRQSGKTTLSRAAFPRKPYVNLEAADERAFARHDPRGFLARFPDGAIIDEAQSVPDLFSYIQALVDEDQRPGRFVLTGSQNFGLVARITQSLAGRVAVLHLLPLSMGELRAGGVALGDIDEWLYRGFYPALYGGIIDPSDWHAAYVTTYLERDVRQITNVHDLGSFQRFLAQLAQNPGSGDAESMT